MIQVQQLTKRYGDKVAVQDVSFEVKKGEIVGFLGRNGAGKTTTMNIITGYISSSAGSVTVDGYDILEQPMEVKKRIGYLPEHPPLYFDMTVNEYLGFVCNIKHVDKAMQKPHLEQICELVGISNMRKRMIRNLSKGYKQRVGLAQALVNNPDVLIFDEPTVGLDPKQISEIRNLIRSLGREHTLVLSSHILPEVAEVCERLVIIHQGRIVAEDTMDHLIHQVSQSNRLTLRVAAKEGEAVKALGQLHGVQDIGAIGSMETGSVDIRIECSQGTDLRPAIFDLLSERKWPILMLKTSDISLEDIFLKLTGDSEEEN